MPLLARAIDSLSVKFVNSGFREIKSPVLFSGLVMPNNYAVQLKKGEITFGNENLAVKENSFVFLPAQKQCYIKYGAGNKYTTLDQDVVSNNPSEVERFLEPIKSTDPDLPGKEVMSYVGFEVLLYNAVSLFTILDMPMFSIPYDSEIAYLLTHICQENEQDQLGKSRMIENYTYELVIQLCRHIKSRRDLIGYIDKLEYLSDKRVIDVIIHIQSNLDKDLSNKVIDSVAFVSEDYVGQFFKSLTGLNLQDYIENQRLEYALKLLRTHPDTIQQIARQVGFKDAAYFSRRFKLKFGMNANTVRADKNYMV